MHTTIKTMTAVGVAMLLSACAGRGYVTGDGEIHSVGGFDTAKIQFEANSCDGIDNSNGEIKMEDKYAIDWEGVEGILFEGTVDSTYFCSLDNADMDAPLCNCGEGYQEINFSYTSKNDNLPGNGVGIACMADIGDGSNKGHNGIAEIQILSGPFEGYQNVGSTNVTQHGCSGN
ncbi:MAG: hypothetical protein ACFHVJ_15395 [Aestuariibacter sp.]